MSKTLRIPDGLTASHFIRGYDMPTANIEYGELDERSFYPYFLTMANGQLWVGLIKGHMPDILKVPTVSITHLHRVEHDRIGGQEVLHLFPINPIAHIKDYYEIRTSLIIRIHAVAKNICPIVEHHIGF